MRRRLLYISTVWPEHRSSAAGVRSWQLLKAFKERGWETACGSIAKTTSFRHELESSGVHTFDCRINSSDVEKAVAEFRPRVVVFERFNVEEMFGWQVRAADPSAIRVIDTQDVNTLRQEREKLLEQRPQASMQEVVNLRITTASALLLRELAAIHRSDAALIVSDFEKELLVRQYGIAAFKLQLAPFFYEPAPESPLPYAKLKDYVFIGNFRHRPNVDAVRWAAASLWPKIRERLEAEGVRDGRGRAPEFHVYGAYARKEDMALSRPDVGFVVKGPTPDQYKALSKYRVLLAPLRVGAGVKGKIADAWWCGVPVVTTPIGAEGMGWIAGSGGGAAASDGPPETGAGGARHQPTAVADEAAWGGLVGWGEADFVDAAVRLYKQEDLWQSCRRDGRAILAERFGEAAAEEVVTFTERLVETAEQRREVDYVQAMLWMQQHRSTEFMAKYLQLKASAGQQQRQQQPVPDEGG